MYPDPETFNPDRWLNPSFPTYREPLTQYPTLKAHSQFGFGRRTCTGVDIVEQELFLVIGGLAWAFDISKKKGKDGKEIDAPADRYTSLLIAKPEKFEFECRLREDVSEEGVEDMWRAVNGGSVEDEDGDGLSGSQVLDIGTPDREDSGSEKDLGSEFEEELVEKEVLMKVGDVRVDCPGAWR